MKASDLISSVVFVHEINFTCETYFTCESFTCKLSVQHHALIDFTCEIYEGTTASLALLESCFK